MPDNLFDPHFNCFPSSKAIEEIEFFDFLVDLLFLKPLCQINKLAWLTISVMAKSFFTDSIILEVVLLVQLPDFLIIDNIKLIYILISLMILRMVFAITFN